MKKKKKKMIDSSFLASFFFFVCFFPPKVREEIEALLGFGKDAQKVEIFIEAKLQGN